MAVMLEGKRSDLQILYTDGLQLFKNKSTGSLAIHIQCFLNGILLYSLHKSYNVSSFDSSVFISTHSAGSEGVGECPARDLLFCRPTIFES